MHFLSYTCYTQHTQTGSQPTNSPQVLIHKPEEVQGSILFPRDVSVSHDSKVCTEGLWYCNALKMEPHFPENCLKYAEQRIMDDSNRWQGLQLKYFSRAHIYILPTKTKNPRISIYGSLPYPKRINMCTHDKGLMLLAHESMETVFFVNICIYTRLNSRAKLELIGCQKTSTKET